ncbi:MAG: hypothetical protein P3X23_009000 [Thermosynechococcus sp. Uc]|nr:hypothetical protein [Thermosynechococcus sp. Uc]MDM7327234.1 hypothetical protein [Thermosynechococcus sp. Uc]HIK25824.1 hypothetical protein [Thermosynechococcus sp. M46_R2017_013]
MQLTPLEEAPQRIAKTLEIRTGDKIGGVVSEIADGDDSTEDTRFSS